MTQSNNGNITNHSHDSFKVIINAQILPGGTSGGVEQFIIGLVHSLGKLVDGPEEYIIIGPWQDPYWLKPYLGPNERIISGPQPSFFRLSLLIKRIKRCLGPRNHLLVALSRVSRTLINKTTKKTKYLIHESNGFYEKLGGDIIHFPSQIFSQCKLPFIYNPHDLQHLHYPQFFTEDQKALREIVYQTGCKQAQAVAAESQWVKKDIMEQYDIDPEKIYVIPRGAPTEIYEQITEDIKNNVTDKFRLPTSFGLYPAQTWPHKNHIRLLKAISFLRDRQGISINLICTGNKNEFWPVIEKEVQNLKLLDQVRFLGFVEPYELRALYQLSQFVVFPSLFEGGGFPVLEAFLEGTPVTCSDVTSLPEYGGDAALYFDPTSVKDMAKAIEKMANDEELRETLRKRGALRIQLYTWLNTAKMYRAIYRKIANRALTKEDRKVLEAAR